MLSLEDGLTRSLTKEIVSPTEEDQSQGTRDQSPSLELTRMARLRVSYVAKMITGNQSVHRETTDNRVLVTRLTQSQHQDNNLWS